MSHHDTGGLPHELHSGHVYGECKIHGTLFEYYSLTMALAKSFSSSFASMPHGCDNTLINPASKRDSSLTDGSEVGLQSASSLRIPCLNS